MDIRDNVIRGVALREISRRLGTRSSLPWAEITAGFTVPGEPDPIRFATRAKGIFKPRQMSEVLSISTRMPRNGRTSRYPDQIDAHAAIYRGDEEIEYAFQGKDPESLDNRLLRDAQLRALPLIYFVAVTPGIYCPLFPAYVTEWDGLGRKVKVVFAP